MYLRITHIFQSVILIAGPMVAAIGLIVMYGWLIHSLSIVQLSPKFVPTQFNEALLFLISGIALISLELKKQTFTRICGIIIALFAAVILSQDLFHWDLHSGRIASNTAICFILAGTTLIIASSSKNTGIRLFILKIIGFIIIAFSSAALFGYMTGWQSTYGWMQVSRMSAISAVGFIAFGVGIMSYSWQTFLSNENSQYYPWQQILPLLIGLFTITLYLWQAMLAEEKARLIANEIGYAEHVKSAIEAYLQDQIEGLIRMANRWEIRKITPQEEWEADASLYVQHQPGLIALKWIDANYTTRWVATEFGEPSEIKENLLRIAEPIKRIESVKKSHQILFAETLRSGDRRQSFSMYVPLFVDGKFDGCFVGIFIFQEAFDEILKNYPEKKYLVSIWDNDQRIYFSHAQNTPSSLPTGTSRVNFYGITWKIDVAMSRETFAQEQSNLPLITLIIGFVLACLIALIVHFALRNRQRSQILQKTIHQLTKAQDSLIAQEKLASLGTLTAGIAHEIKNPLNFINNFSELCINLVEEISNDFSKHKEAFTQEELDQTDESINTLKNNVVTILEQGKRANNIVQRMLAHSRDISREVSLTDINSLLEEYLNLSYHGMRVTNPLFNVKIEKKCDPSVGKKQVIAEDISRVFLNIFNNAYYALNQKKNHLGESFQPVMSLKTQNFDDRFEIRIRDNGNGIPPIIQDKVFTPFFTTKPAGEGTGLGLSLSHNIIVQEHGGSLTFQTKEGEFTEFIISLPNKPISP
jgi:signal transduction histidine kinase